MSFSTSPAPRRSAKTVSASPWKDHTKGSPDRRPWDVTKMPRVIADGAAPGASIEVRLRAMNTLRLSTEASSASDRDALRKHKSLPLILATVIDAVDESESGARVRVHALLSIINLIGEDERFDEFVVLDADVMGALLRCLHDEHVSCVSAAAQLVRRISELEHCAHLVVFDDALFERLLTLLEDYDEPAVTTHVLSALINTAAMPKAQFAMARSSRLLHALLDTIFRAEEDPGRATQSAKVIGNLLAFDGNGPEVERLAPSLVNALLEGIEATDSEELHDVARSVLQSMRNQDVYKLNSQLRGELAVGSAVSTRVRRGASPDYPASPMGMQ